MVLQVQPQDVLAANYAGDRAAAAAVATTSKPVVKFVPKRISLWGERDCLAFMRCWRCWNATALVGMQSEVLSV